MKKLLVLVAVLVAAIACTSEPDTLKFHVEFVPVVSVETPEQMSVGSTYEFKVKYARPNDCYYFDGFYHETDATAQIIAVQTLVIQDAECRSLEGVAPDEASFDFTCPATYSGGNCIFKFYQGEDGEGIQQYLEVEIPVL